MSFPNKIEREKKKALSRILLNMPVNYRDFQSILGNGVWIFSIRLEI
jgi:hypothetical protein